MSVCPSVFDQKCLNLLKTLREPWRIPQAAQSWCIDCADAQAIIGRYLQSGWVMMCSPGQYRLTTGGKLAMNAMRLSMSALEHDIRDGDGYQLPRHAIGTVQHSVLHLLSNGKPLAAIQIAQILDKNLETVRRSLAGMAEKNLVKRQDSENRFRLWSLTPVGESVIQSAEKE